MKYQIISDIHANLAALEAVIEDAPAGAIPLHIGDLVGYGPQPNEVVSWIRAMKVIGVRGNHEDLALGLEDLSQYSESAKNSGAWTAAQLTPENLEYLAALPYSDLIEDVHQPFQLVHGSPHEPKAFNYVFGNGAAARGFRSMTSKIAFIGHTHHPESYSWKMGKVKQIKHGIEGGVDALVLEDDHQYILNVGSVGQPRDKNPHASYVLFDSETKTVTWKRVAYDVAGTQSLILATNLPKENAVRIGLGK